MAAIAIHAAVTPFDRILRQRSRTGRRHCNGTLQRPAGVTIRYTSRAATAAARF
jgi:hypothetical protein